MAEIKGKDVTVTWIVDGKIQRGPMALGFTRELERVPALVRSLGFGVAIRAAGVQKLFDEHHQFQHIMMRVRFHVGAHECWPACLAFNLWYGSSCHHARQCARRHCTVIDHMTYQAERVLCGPGSS